MENNPNAFTPDQMELLHNRDLVKLFKQEFPTEYRLVDAMLHNQRLAMQVDGFRNRLLEQESGIEQLVSENSKLEGMLHDALGDKPALKAVPPSDKSK